MNERKRKSPKESKRDGINKRSKTERMRKTQKRETKSIKHRPIA